MKHKTYHVNTVQDMIDCTNSDNLDNFLIDLKGVLTSSYRFREIGNIKSKGFEWVDDGNHDIKTIIEIKQ